MGPFDTTFDFWMNKRLYREKEQLQEIPASPLIIRLKIGGRCLKQRNQEHYTSTTIWLTSGQPSRHIH